MSPTRLPLLLMVACLDWGKGEDTGDAGTTDPGVGQTWTGTKEIVVTTADLGQVCDLWWSTSGTRTYQGCPDCDFTFEVECTFDAASSDLGSCDPGQDWAWTIGYAPDYYEGYDVMLVAYGDAWYPAYLATFDGTTLFYSNFWYQQGATTTYRLASYNYATFE